MDAVQFPLFMHLVIALLISHQQTAQLCPLSSQDIQMKCFIIFIVLDFLYGSRLVVYSVKRVLFLLLQDLHSITKLV